MTRIRTALVGLGAAAVLMLAACGNGPPTNDTSPAQPQGSSSSGGGGGDITANATGTPAATVKQTDALKFDPSSTSVKVGDIVEWDNTSSVGHNVTFDSGTASATMNNGDKFLAKFTKAGSYHYVCTFHSGMEGTITVS